MKRIVILTSILAVVAAATAAAATAGSAKAPDWIRGSRTQEPAHASKDRRTLASSVGIPTSDSHASCTGYSSWYSAANVTVWIPNVDPIASLGYPQRVYWQTTVWQQGRSGAWSKIGSSRMAYMDSWWTQAWYDGETNAFLGQSGHVPVVFPLNSDTVQAWVDDEYCFYNPSTGYHVMASRSAYLSC